MMGVGEGGREGNGGREEEQKQDKKHEYSEPGGPAFVPSQFQCRCPGES